MAARVPGDTSVDAHHAGNAVTDRTNAPGASGSVDAHHAADDFTDTTLALMSYNICIQNPEPHSGKNWTNSAAAFGLEMLGITEAKPSQGLYWHEGPAINGPLLKDSADRRNVQVAQSQDPWIIGVHFAVKRRRQQQQQQQKHLHTTTTCSY